MYINFFLSIIIPPILHTHLSPAADTIGPFEVAVRRNSVSHHSHNYHPRLKIKTGTCEVLLRLNISDDSELQ
jgi:hypothetical protein